MRTHLVGVPAGLSRAVQHVLLPKRLGVSIEDRAYSVVGCWLLTVCTSGEKDTGL